MTIVANVLIQTRVAATQDTLDPNPVVENVSSFVLCLPQFKIRINALPRIFDGANTVPLLF